MNGFDLRKIKDLVIRSRDRIIAAVFLCVVLAFFCGYNGKKRGADSVNAQPISDVSRTPSVSEAPAAQELLVASETYRVTEQRRRWADMPIEALAELSLSEHDLIEAKLAEKALDEEDEESEYARLAIADVAHYVNVRSIPSTEGKILGKIYHGAVAEILETAGEDDEWFHVISGNVEGYIKAEYFIYGDAAVEVIDDYVTRKVVVQATRLNVRKEPDIEAKRIGYLDHGERALVLENAGDWIKIQYSDEKEGYVAAEYVTIAEEFIYAKSIEEERAEKEALRALQKRQEVAEENHPEDTTVIPPVTNYSTNAELRAEIINYALQFVGNRYVNGGNSLTNGTDCSGFTSLIYADFGYSLGRTPSSQYKSAGRAIDYSEIQPGDIICYSGNGGKSCTHVALYIGDGQIVHAANSRKGIITSDANYGKIIGIRNVID